MKQGVVLGDQHPLLLGQSGKPSLRGHMDLRNAGGGVVVTIT